MQRDIDPDQINGDWIGNNIAVECPLCKKVFIVSEFIHHGERQCPKCSKSRGVVHGSRDKGGQAFVMW